MERTGVGYEPFTPEQQQGVFNMLDRYVAADEASEEEVLSINSFRDILEVCKQFKKMVLKGQQDVDEARLEAQHAVMEQVCGVLLLLNMQRFYTVVVARL